ncbi:MAG: hypothetical protein EXS35_11580 [Pedosphaera sp.]|nr:hypothetical protein [Pedosphaera sp.]
MTHEEVSVLEYLKGSPDSYYGRKEIARRAIRRTEYEENPRWAEAALTSLVDREVLETNDSGAFRVKTKEKYR